MAREPRRFDPKTFQEWRNSPINRPFFQWLTDQRDQLARQWAAGQEMDSRQQVKALLLGELSAPEWADYATFYGVEVTDPDETESASQ